ncbi:CHAT domain-containing protein [Russula compacta]|nr:CHAT domain-containing protein [Russula compacta]
MADTQFYLLKADNAISQLQNALLIFPRSHPLRSEGLSTLAKLRLTRYQLSDDSEDLDKSICHSTEAIVLPFDTPTALGSYITITNTLFYLARALLLRSQKFEQLSDLKHVIKYLRYFQDESLETSEVTRNSIKACLVWALSIQVKLESADPMEDIREVVIPCRELFTSDFSESVLPEALNAFASAMCMARVLGVQRPPDEAIECLREVTRRFPNLKRVRLALALTLFTCFHLDRLHGDYEEAMLILDEMIADQDEYVDPALRLARTLAGIRFRIDPRPEHLAEAIFRFHARLNVMSSEDPDRPPVVAELAELEKIRFEEFGVRSGLQEDDPHPIASPQKAKSNFIEFPLPMPDKRDLHPHINALHSMRDITDLTNMGKAIEYCRLCLTSPHSDVPFTLQALGDLLYRVYDLTGNVDYLGESITVYRDLIKMPSGPMRLDMVAASLISALTSRFKLFKDRRDSDQIVELLAIVTDGSTDLPRRFQFSCTWTLVARSWGHPTTRNAYETAISLMQESLSFAPTLEIQHFRLVLMREQYEKLPLDYASYLVQTSQLKQAIEALERGRGLLWSEMRGLRASVDQLHAVNLPLAKKFAAVNRNLEALTISGTRVAWMEDEQVSGREGMDPVGRLVVKQRKLVEERDSLISQIRAQPGLDTFLIPPSFDTLHSAAAGGPVILINHSEWRSDIIILLRDSPPSLIPTSDDFYDRAKGLHDKLLAARKSGLDSSIYNDALRYVLKELYDLVGRPVIERLRKLDLEQPPRVWWCPTSVFCSLPLHAMGPIQSDGPTGLYFSDLYITSYTPTLSALIESRKLSTQPSGMPSMLLVVQPDAKMPRSFQEMQVVQTVCPLVETLSGKKATPIAALDRLREHRFAHISCHGILETGKPFDAFFKLYEGAPLTLLDIVRSRLPMAEFAFLSACHTAEITEKSIADEGLHLTAAVQYSGFRSVVGTMWAMADIDGPVLAESFYKLVFSNKWQGKPYYERTAEALRDAVRDLRRKKKMTLERWVNYVHYGA